MAEKYFLQKFADVSGRGLTVTATSVKTRPYVTKITTEEDLHESAPMMNHGGSVKNLINRYESKTNGEGGFM